MDSRDGDVRAMHCRWR